MLRQMQCIAVWANCGSDRQIYSGLRMAVFARSECISENILLRNSKKSAIKVIGEPTDRPDAL